MVEPSRHGVRVAWLEQPEVSHGRGSRAGSDLEDGSTALADRGLGIVVAMREQGGALVVRERQGTALGHGKPPLGPFTIIMIRCSENYHSCGHSSITGEPNGVHQA